MQIVIPTRGRVHEQVTWNSLPASISKNVQLVVRQDEAHKYDPKYPLLIMPWGPEGIAETRDWIVDKFPNDLICMLDDDMRFFTRRMDDPTKFLPIQPYDVKVMFDTIECSLHRFAHVGIAAREGANRRVETTYFNSRAMRLLAYDTAYIKRLGLEFGPATFMCDFHMTLSLLEQGLPNIILNSWCNDQKSSDAPGGCSGQRTATGQTQAAYWMAEHHHPYVAVVNKKTKTAWGGLERTDVIIQWKRAYEDAINAAKSNTKPSASEPGP